MRFNAAAPAGLIAREAPGLTPQITDEDRQPLAAQIDQGPIQAFHGAVRWRLCDLGQWLWEEFRLSVSRQTMSRKVGVMGYRKLSARPKHHIQAEGAIEAFKECSPAPLAGIARKQGLDAIEMSFDDEAPVGRKNGITCRWARRGSRPSPPQDSATPRPTSCVPSAGRRTKGRPWPCGSATPRR